MNANQPIEFIEYAFIYQPLTGECGLFRYWENLDDGNFWFETTMDKEEGRPHSRLRVLIERYFIYPPGGLAGIKAAYKVMNHV